MGSEERVDGSESVGVGGRVSVDCGRRFCNGARSTHYSLLTTRYLRRSEGDGRKGSGCNLQRRYLGRQERVAGSEERVGGSSAVGFGGRASVDGGREIW